MKDETNIDPFFIFDLKFLILKTFAFYEIIENH